MAEAQLTLGAGGVLAMPNVGFSPQAANLVIAGPSSGSAAVPDFRSLVAADLPSLSANAMQTMQYSGSVWSAVNPAPWPFRRYAQMTNSPNANNTRLQYGASGITPSANATANNDTIVWSQTKYTTSNVSGNASAMAMGLELRRDWLAEGIICFQTGADITTTRLFVGMSDTTLGNADAPSANMAMLRYSTNVPDTGWRAITGAGSTPTVSAQVAAIAASTYYMLWIKLKAASVEFWLSENLGAFALVHTATLTLPTSTTRMGLSWYHTTLSNATRDFNWCRFSSVQNG